jgi:hypothetical protein
MFSSPMHSLVVECLGLLFHLPLPLWHGGNLSPTHILQSCSLMMLKFHLWIVACYRHLHCALEP